MWGLPTLFSPLDSKASPFPLLEKLQVQFLVLSSELGGVPVMIRIQSEWQLRIDMINVKHYVLFNYFLIKCKVKKWNIYIYILCTIYLISVFYNVVWNIAIVVRSISISQTKISIFIFQMFEINLCKWSWKFESLSIYLYNLTSSINLN